MDDFSRLIGNLRVLPEGFAEDMILKAPSKYKMNKIARSVLAAYSYDSNPDDISTGNILRQSIELIARLPVMASICLYSANLFKIDTICSRVILSFGANSVSL